MGLLDGLAKTPAQATEQQKKARDEANEKQRREMVAQSRYEMLMRHLLQLHQDLTHHTWEQEIETYTSAPKPFSRRGLPYNGIFCSDGQAGKKLTVQVAGGPTYTVTLTAGMNVLNLPDECNVTTQASGDTETVLLVWSSHRLS